ncbi:hypothetical protein C0995_016434 [Termitomyces sp. Mi166|nr:hypothetical protein C0995_016434 [Termitomyces sp. Mi166\
MLKNQLQPIMNTGKVKTNVNANTNVPLVDRISPTVATISGMVVLKPWVYVYVLTMEEHNILTEHCGCFQCHCIYIDHLATQCLDKGEPLTLAKYNPRKLTPAFVEATLRSCAKGTALSSAPIMVAMVFKDLSEEDTSSEVGDEYVLPKHMTYSCFVSAPSITPTLVENALIDSGAPPAMISMMLNFIVCSNLHADLILGLQFLEKNSILIDLEVHTAVDKKMGFNLLHPPDPKKKCESRPIEPHIKRHEERKAKQVKKEWIKKGQQEMEVAQRLVHQELSELFAQRSDCFAHLEGHMAMGGPRLVGLV